MEDSPDRLPRLMEPALARALRSSPVVVLTGARQTGKSTLARTADGRSRHYVTLDDLEALARAREAPDALVRSASRITLDEVQRSPELLLAVKRAVDEKRTPGRFVLTGSANFHLLRRIAESLAGRAVYLTLWPLTRSERRGRAEAGAWPQLVAARDRDWAEVLDARDAPRADWRREVRVGGYPVPSHGLRTEEDRALWFAGYVQTYLERDLRDLSAVASLVDFRRLMRAACLRVGNLVNQTELGRDVGMPQPTVHRHLDLLEASYQLVRVPAFAVNRTKRLIKTPKLYWSDAALAMHLAAEEEPRGAHLENLVLSDLLAWRGAEAAHTPEVLYWRTAVGDEVDFVVERGGDLLPIEVKAGARPRIADARGLLAFRAEYPDRSRAGLLLHAGSETTWIAEGVLATPWWRVI